MEHRVDASLWDRPLLRVLGLTDKPFTTREFIARWDEEFPDAGHFWQVDEPEAVAAAIRDVFAALRKIPPRSR